MEYQDNKDDDVRPDGKESGGIDRGDPMVVTAVSSEEAACDGEYSEDLSDQVYEGNNVDEEENLVISNEIENNDAPGIYFEIRENEMEMVEDENVINVIVEVVDTDDNNSYYYTSEEASDDAGTFGSSMEEINYGFQNCSSANPVFREIFYSFCNPTIPNCTMKEFMSQYLASFVEPTGWVAEWWKVDYKNVKPLYEWPRPKYLYGLVQVESVDMNALTATGRLFLRGSVGPDDERGDISGESTVVNNIPIHELVPLKPTVEGCLLNLLGMKDGLEGLRLLKDHLIMQAQDDISADIFFNGELQRLENMYQDLETPGCLSNKMRNKTIDLICSLRDLLDIIKTMEVEAQNESRECNERELMILNQKLFGIWNDLSVLQIPAIRKETFPCSEDQLNDTDINDVSSSKVFMVGNHNSFPFEHILAVKNTLKERQQEFKIDDIDSLSFCTDLKRTLQNCQNNSVVFLLPGKYEIPSIGAIALGGFLIGLPDDLGNQPTISTYGTGDVWNVISTTDSVCSIENLSFVVNDGYAEQILASIFTVTGGSLALLNCKLECSHFNKSTCNAGVYQQLSMIDVRNEAKVTAINSVFKGAQSVIKQGITNNSFSLMMKGCSVENVIHFLDIKGADITLNLYDIVFRNVSNVDVFCSEWPEDKRNVVVNSFEQVENTKFILTELNLRINYSIVNTPTTSLNRFIESHGQNFN